MAIRSDPDGQDLIWPKGSVVLIEVVNHEINVPGVAFNHTASLPLLSFLSPANLPRPSAIDAAANSSKLAIQATTKRCKPIFSPNSLLSPFLGRHPSDGDGQPRQHLCHTAQPAHGRVFATTYVPRMAYERDMGKTYRRRGTDEDDAKFSPRDARRDAVYPRRELVRQTGDRRRGPRKFRSSTGVAMSVERG